MTILVKESTKLEAVSMAKKPKASVIVIAYNEEKYLPECIRSILDQSFKNFELIIVDDCSTDHTPNIINRFGDKRLARIRNKENYNIAKSRNVGVKAAKGEFIFFTDADCVADKNWIRNGLKQFRDKNILGVDGLTCYGEENYKPTPSDKIRGTLYGDRFNTCNIAYRKDAIQKVGGFDEKRYAEAYEDSDLAFRILRSGKIIHCKDMVVLHQKKEFGFISLFKRLRWAKYPVRLIKDYYFFPAYRTLYLTIGHKKARVVLPFKVLFPTNLAYIAFFPYFLFHVFFFRRINSLKQLIFIMVVPAYFILERFVIWKTAIKERAFVL